MCVCVCACITMKKSARRMASTTSDTGDTSSKQQQAQCKENYNKSKRPVSSVDHCHPYRRKKRRELIQLSVHICRIEKERSLIRWNGLDRNEFRLEEKQFTKPTHVAVYLFRDLNRDRSRI